MYFRASDTIRLALVIAKDRLPKEEQQNVVYDISCHDYNAAYAGETNRQLNVKLKKHKQHLKHVPKSSIHLKKLANNLAIALHVLKTEHRIN